MSPLRKQGSMAKKLDSCPFGFAQGRPFAGMTKKGLFCVRCSKEICQLA